MSAPASAAIGVNVDHVSKRFTHRVKGEIYAARDVTLHVEPGQFVTLLGPSGCGKTTTLRMIAGFERPDAGRILFAGHDVTELPANQRGIGFVFQNYALFPHLSVFENVAYGLRVRSHSGDVIAREVADVLSLVGLAGYEQQLPSQLSGGEQQRIALARAIVIRPRVLLFDEPLSNLDARLRVQMRSEIRDLQRRLAITAIYVTHDQEEAMAVSDLIAVMEAGTIVQQGSAEDLYHRPASQFVAQFIGRANLVAARVESATAGEAIVVALGRRFRVRAAIEARAGDAVRLLLRPEAIAVDRRASGVDALRGTVVHRTFLGEKIDYRLQVAGESLQATSYNAGVDKLAAEGESVAVHVDDAAVVLIASERASAA